MPGRSDWERRRRLSVIEPGQLTAQPNQGSEQANQKHPLEPMFRNAFGVWNGMKWCSMAISSRMGALGFDRGKGQADFRADAFVRPIYRWEEPKGSDRP